MIFSSLNNIPDGYIKIWEADLINNRKSATRKYIAELLISFAVLLIVAIIHFDALASVEEIVIGLDTLVCLVLFLVGIVLIINIHVLIHGLICKIGTKEKLKVRLGLFYVLAAVPTAYFKKWHFFIVTIAPFVIINSILIGLCFAPINAPWIVLIYALLIMHAGKCADDFYMLYKLLGAKSSVLISDIGENTVFYDNQ